MRSVWIVVERAAIILGVVLGVLLTLGGARDLDGIQALHGIALLFVTVVLGVRPKWIPGCRGRRGRGP